MPDHVEVQAEQEKQRPKLERQNAIRQFPQLDAEKKQPSAAPEEQVQLKTKAPDYNVIIDYFQEKSVKDKKAGLFAYFMNLNPLQRQFAINAMAGGKASDVNLTNVKKNMKSGFIFRSINWNKFSEISRDAAKRDIQDPFASSNREKASTGFSGLSVANAGVGASASIANAAKESAAATVAAVTSPLGASIGIAGSLAQVAVAAQHYDESLDATEKAQVIGGEGLSGMADAVRNSSQAVETSQNFAGQAVSAGVTMAAGIAGVVGGAFYMTSGLVGAKTAHDRSKILDQMEQRGADQKDENMVKTAKLAKSTAQMNVTKHSMTALKGGLMIAGGALLIALGTNPIGWTLLGVAAIVGGVAAVKKMWDKRSRKAEVVDRHFDMDDKYKKFSDDIRSKGGNESDLPTKERFRKLTIQENGYNNVEQAYNEIVKNMAELAYRKAVIDKEQEYIDLIEALGLKIDYVKRTPNPDLIAEKMHNG